MAARIVLYLLDEIQLDDRDSWGVKRIESAAQLMEQLFTAMTNIWAEKIREVLSKNTSSTEIEKFRFVDMND